MKFELKSQGNFLYLFFIVLVSILIYFQILNNGYTKLDDVMIIENNWENLHRPGYILEAFQDDIFEEAKGSYYRPVQVLSYMLDCWIFSPEKDKPMPFFLSNLLLFLLNSVLLYFFLLDFKLSRINSFLGTLLICIHPATVPAVAWIPGKIELYIFFFFLINTWSIKRYFESGNLILLFIYCFSLLLGVFTKETALILPPIAFIIYMYLNHQWENIQFNSFNYWKKTILQFIKNKWLVVLLSGFIVLFYFVMRSISIPETDHGLIYMFNQIPFTLVSLVIFTGSFFIPFDLAVFHAQNWNFVIIPFFLLPTITYFISDKIINKKRFLLGILWYILFLLPTFMANKIVYHRMYFPMIGLIFAISSIDWKSIIVQQKLRNLSLGLFFIWLIVNNIDFQQSFDNKLNYWNNALKHSPEDVLTNRGIAYLLHVDHKYDSALVYYEKAYEADSSVAHTLLGIALIHHKLGNDSLADYYMSRELSVTVDSGYVYSNYADIMMDRKKYDLAIEYFTAAYNHSGNKAYLLKSDSLRKKN